MLARRPPGFALLWLVVFAIAGAAIPAVFSTGLRWERSRFLLPYVSGIGVLLMLFFRRAGAAWDDARHAWPYGLLATVVASFLLIRNILGQPSSAVPEGGWLVLGLLWIGLVYGTIDGLLLNVMPVVATQGAGFYRGPASKARRLGMGVLAMGASLFVTAAYHTGYTEFHGAKMASVLVGNVIITGTYLLTGSPMAPVLTHVVMHATALLHGMETTIQLPPHYN